MVLESSTIRSGGPLTTNFSIIRSRQNYVQMSVSDYLGSDLEDRINRDCIKICEALGYDMNTIEFAIEDGIPYAIDYMNPAPDAELSSVKEENFRWMVNAVADLAIEY